MKASFPGKIEVRFSVSPADRLLDCHSRALTGCLASRRRDGMRIRVFLSDGDIVAAHADDDENRILRRLVAQESLSLAQSAELRDGASSDYLIDLLYEHVPEEVLSHVLFERFKENIAQLLTAPSVQEFEPLEFVGPRGR